MNRKLGRSIGGVAIVPLAILVIAAGLPAYAAPIYDASFFDNIPHTLIDFETFGNGEPVYARHTGRPNDPLSPGQTTPLELDEYTQQGFVFEPLPATPPPPGRMTIAHDRNPNVMELLELFSSPRYFLAAKTSFGEFTITFNEPVFSFGTAVYHNINTGFTPHIDVIGENGRMETILFQDSVAGSLGNLQYGFMGFGSSEPITQIAFHGSASYDDFHFSHVVPEPSTSTLVLLTAIAAVGRYYCDR